MQIKRRESRNFDIIASREPMRRKGTGFLRCHLDLGSSSLSNSPLKNRERDKQRRDGGEAARSPSLSRDPTFNPNANHRFLYPKRNLEIT